MGAQERGAYLFTMVERGKEQPGSHSQTLSRGIRALEALAQADGALSIDELALRLEVHRSIAYRMVRTLEHHRLITRDPAGRCLPGAGLAVLAHSVSRDLQDVALPELAAVADELAMTTLIVVADQEECVTLSAVEPRRASAAVAQRPGSRHALERGAPGIALLTLVDDTDRAPEARAHIAESRAQGYAISHDEVITGVSSVAVPIPSRGPVHAALAVVYVGTDRSIEDIADRLHRAAQAIGTQVG